MPNPFSDEVPQLLQAHLDHLLASAISIEVIRERGYRTAMGKAPIREAGFSKSQQRAPGILIPLHAPDGSGAGFLYRPDNPRTNPKGKPIKYESPRSGSLRLDMPLRCKEAIGDPSIPLWITEGAKKADALASIGACAVSLNGVWGFKGQNKTGGITVLADWDYISLKDRLVYLAFDSDSATNPHVRQALERLREHLRRKDAQVMVITLPAGPDGGKVGADDYLAAGHTIDDLVSLVSDALPDDETEDEPIALHNPLYAVHQGRFCIIKNIKDIGKVYFPLCNFTAQIAEEVIHDNGIEEERRFMVEGTLAGGHPLPRADVTATGFPGLGWVTEKWGAKAIVHAGSSTKDHLRCMIQMSANGSEPRRVFTHTGWRDIDGERVFLTASGALGREGVEVSLKGSLSRYRLPTDLAEIEADEAMRASISFMDFGRHEVMCPLWSYMYLAPLVEILNPAFTLWLIGHTGSFKSVLSSLALCHFGEFTYLTLPASWRDTANRLEWTMSMLKDLPLVVDDWHPGPTAAAQKELDAKAEIVVRGQGNKAGRGRLRSDATARESYTPRGLVVSSGEQLPGGESHASRLFVLELEPGDVDTDHLNIAQSESFLYRHAMAHYILWLRDNWEYFTAHLPSRWEEWRDRAMDQNRHLRLPAAVAWLYAGLDLGLTFALQIGAIGKGAADERREAAWAAFVNLASIQGDRVEEERPASLFLDAFSTLLRQQRIILTDKDCLEPTEKKPGQEFVGWVDDEWFYLMPKGVYQVVADFYHRSGQYFGVKLAALCKDLVRLGLARAQDKVRNQSRVRMGSGDKTASPWVIQLKRSSISEKVEGGY